MSGKCHVPRFHALVHYTLHISHYYLLLFVITDLYNIHNHHPRPSSSSTYINTVLFLCPYNWIHNQSSICKLCCIMLKIYTWRDYLGLKIVWVWRKPSYSDINNTYGTTRRAMILAARLSIVNTLLKLEKIKNKIDFSFQNKCYKKKVRSQNIFTLPPEFSKNYFEIISNINILLISWFMSYLYISIIIRFT